MPPGLDQGGTAEPAPPLTWDSFSRGHNTPWGAVPAAARRRARRRRPHGDAARATRAHCHQSRWWYVVMSLERIVRKPLVLKGDANAGAPRQDRPPRPRRIYGQATGPTRRPTVRPTDSHQRAALRRGGRGGGTRGYSGSSWRQATSAVVNNVPHGHGSVAGRGVLLRAGRVRRPCRLPAGATPRPRVETGSRRGTVGPGSRRPGHQRGGGRDVDELDLGLESRRHAARGHGRSV